MKARFRLWRAWYLRDSLVRISLHPLPPNPLQVRLSGYKLQIGSGSRIESRFTIDTEFCHGAAFEELTEGSCLPASKRIRRANTLEEKRSMRRARKKRQQQRYAMGAMELRKKISEQEDQLRDSERKGITGAWQKHTGNGGVMS